MNPSVLRVIDANANRAREALRVVEDYARFVLDSGQLSAALKELRHGLAGALAGVLEDAIVQRDTPGDVGTANKTGGELRRDDVAHVVTAAGKRLGEALRAIEEFAKVIDPARARAVERLRYQFYDLERRIALTLRPAWRKLAEARLYVLITESACAGDWYETAERAIDGGAQVLQLREKELEGGELLRRAKRFVELCRRRGVISIINDRVDVALLSGADGVHVGQGDLPAGEVRRMIGREKIIGVSTHNIDHARRAVADGADYIGAGPFFRSPTKPRDFVAGPEYARQVAAEIHIPAFAIAGINETNLDQVLATGIHGIAVTAAVTQSPDPAAAAARLSARLREAADQGVPTAGGGTAIADDGIPASGVGGNADKQ